jgi:NADPH-dependent curcumin reductase CurA
MAPTQTKTFIVNELPVKSVNYELGQEHSTFKLVDQPLNPLKDGYVRVKTLYLSNDPTQRTWIQKGINPERMYVPPVGQGEPMRSLGMGQVIESKSSKYKDGDIVVCQLYWSQYCDLMERQIDSTVPDTSIPLPIYLSSLGMTGLTAYFGIRDIGQAKKGDTVVVSAASGATGSMVVQIAKAIGCHVIGISGGEEKCRYVESIGADACVNYKDANFKESMQKALGDKKFCDIFFDNVGGEILDTMLTLTKVQGTIVACGAISGYNDHTKMQIKNWGEIITNRLTVKGFIIIDHKHKYGTAVKEIAGWIKQGKVKADESFNLVDLTGESKFTDIPTVWSTLFSDSKKPGKLLTKLADPKL